MPIPLIPILSTGNIRVFSTERGVCNPEQPYSGFNVCHYTGANPEHITECRRELVKQFGLTEDRLIIPRQTHSTNVLTLTSLPISNDELENTDAIVTNMTDVIIGINTADCVPVILTDPSTGIVGLAHAGWRGAVGGIVESTVSAMVTLGADLSQIHAAMGPSICIDCFEVGDEVATQFSNDCVRRFAGQKPHVSIHQHIINALIKSGVRMDYITPFNKELCTRCHPDVFWSARKSGINSGRIFTFAIISDKDLEQEITI